jgi:undecaprenyl pyrophosphate phosphatase UppP
MPLWQIGVLAVTQGLAELLPISSSAHVIVVQRLLGLGPGAPEMTFLLVMLHTGTMFAVLIYFWPRWRQRLGSGTSAPGAVPAWSFLKMIVIATVCTGILGLGLKVTIERLILEKLLGHPHGEVEQLFRNLPLMAIGLFTVGLFIIAAGVRDEEPGTSTLSGWAAAVIGIVQSLCLPFRGFSRSGATISTALVYGDSARAGRRLQLRPRGRAHPSGHRAGVAAVAESSGFARLGWATSRRDAPRNPWHAGQLSGGARRVAMALIVARAGSLAILWLLLPVFRRADLARLPAWACRLEEVEKSVRNWYYHRPCPSSDPQTLLELAYFYPGHPG